MKIAAGTLIRLGGELCLDFTNTKHWITAPGKGTGEFLTDYFALLRWSLQSGTLTADDAAGLADRALAQPRRARAVLKRALRLREVIHRLFAAERDGKIQCEVVGDLADFNRELRAAGSRQSVEKALGTFRWGWGQRGAALDGVLWPVVRSAAELLVSDRRSGVKTCGGCGWLFLDTSRRGNRRWCDMRFCGNRAKSRRHYERARSADG